MENTVETLQPSQNSSLTAILEDGAREAYSRPWHKLERGLRLNRLRLWVNEMYSALFKPSEIEHVFMYLSQSLDKKLLNTSKIVEYDPIKHRIVSIKNFDVRRQADGSVRCGFLKKKTDTEKAKSSVSSKSHGVTRRNKIKQDLSGVIQ